MLHALGPRHLAHMDQPFNTLFQLDESAVIGHAQNAAFYARANGIALRGVKPWIRRELLKAEGDAQLFRIVLQHLYLDLVAHVDEVAGMRQPAPGHVSDMQQRSEEHTSE